MCSGPPGYMNNANAPADTAMAHTSAGVSRHTRLTKKLSGSYLSRASAFTITYPLTTKKISTPNQNGMSTL